MPTQPDPTGRHLRQFRILLAAPPHASQKLLEAHLHQHDPIIDLAVTAQQTFEAVQDGNYDVVLMGVAHLNFDAREVTRRIRALPEPQSSIAIIGFTDMMGAPEACIAAGMDYTVSSSLLDGRILQALIGARARRPD